MPFRKPQSLSEFDANLTYICEKMDFVDQMLVTRVSPDDIQRQWISDNSGDVRYFTETIRAECQRDDAYSLWKGFVGAISEVIVHLNTHILEATLEALTRWDSYSFGHELWVAVQKLRLALKDNNIVVMSPDGTGILDY